MTEPVNEEERLRQEKPEEEIPAWAREYAKTHGYVLNPDKKRLRVVIKGLARNLTKHGEKYCPCRVRTGDREENRVIICPSIYHGKEIEELGMCHCNLFFRRNEPGKIVQ